MGNIYEMTIENYKQRREKLQKKLQQIKNGECEISEREFDEIKKEANEINKYFSSNTIISQYEIDSLLSALLSPEDDDFINKMVSEFLIPSENKCITTDSPIIVISPINKRILDYLLSNPQELYNLSSIT